MSVYPTHCNTAPSRPPPRGYVPQWIHSSQHHPAFRAPNRPCPCSSPSRPYPTEWPLFVYLGVSASWGLGKPIPMFSVCPVDKKQTDRPSTLMPHLRCLISCLHPQPKKTVSFVHLKSSAHWQLNLNSNLFLVAHRVLRENDLHVLSSNSAPEATE